MSFPDPYDEDAPPPALGTVVDEGRGSLPYALIHGESLVACASWALGDAGVTLVDYSTTWAGIRDGQEPYVLHDALCPMTPATFLSACVARAVDTGSVVVGCSIGPAGRVVTSPIVLPASVVAALSELPTYDFELLVQQLSERFPLEYAESPAVGRRVVSVPDLAALEAESTP
ncbi:2-C-methyl-D-erythritol 4-phosphate cytidylyltransferase [Nocardioides sp.]|uniref:2-C-methyl-D-erythritol 4-phosphate cytidylyltransferase n=1 Tax=Nocardioides sp. TaxID=35761 RepID=UPI003D0A9D9F